MPELDQHSSGALKNRPSRPEMLSTVEKLEREHPQLAAMLVPAGVTRSWGFALGWPDWLWRDTCYASETELPKRLSLSEDLRILANLCDRYSHMELIRILFLTPHVPGERQNSHAPNLSEAINLMIRSINIHNPQIRLSRREEVNQTLVEFAFDESLAAFKTLYELTILVLLWRLIHFFSGFRVDRALDTNLLHVQTTIEEETFAASVEGLIKGNFTYGRESTHIRLPKDMLSLSNPESDWTTWKTIKAEIEILERAKGTTWHMSKNDLIETVRADLLDGKSPPTFSQLANSLEISERSLSRVFNAQKTSLKEVKTLVRMELAKDLMLKSDFSLNQISKQLGFSDPSSFTRAFKKQCADTPGNWRRRQNAQVRQASQILGGDPR
jgi:AraC-like DNA-binding protein